MASYGFLAPLEMTFQAAPAPVAGVVPKANKFDHNRQGVKAMKKQSKGHEILKAEKMPEGMPGGDGKELPLSKRKGRKAPRLVGLVVLIVLVICSAYSVSRQLWIQSCT
jgi:hypothetical protein